MIPQDKLAELAATLESDRERIERELDAMKNSDFGDTPGQDDEDADEVEEMSNKLATLQLLERRLLDINDALERIGAGAYGICTRCGQEISIELLTGNPESSLCKGCKAAL